MVMKDVILNSLLVVFYTNSFIFWESVMVMKEIIFNSFYFGRAWWS